MDSYETELSFSKFVAPRIGNGKKKKTDSRTANVI